MVAGGARGARVRRWRFVLALAFVATLPLGSPSAGTSCLR